MFLLFSQWIHNIADTYLDENIRGSCLIPGRVLASTWSTISTILRGNEPTQLVSSTTSAYSWKISLCSSPHKPSHTPYIVVYNMRFWDDTLVGFHEASVSRRRLTSSTIGPQCTIKVSKSVKFSKLTPLLAPEYSEADCTPVPYKLRMSGNSMCSLRKRCGGRAASTLSTSWAVCIN